MNYENHTKAELILLLEQAEEEIEFLTEIGAEFEAAYARETRRYVVALVSAAWSWLILLAIVTWWAI